MKKQDELTSYLLQNNKKITDADVEFYKNNPEELDLLVNKETLQVRILYYFFIIGIILLFGGKLVSYFFKHAVSEFISEVIIDGIIEIGNAILGGVIAAYLLEYLQKRQYQQNIAFRREIKRRIKENSTKTNNVS